MATSRSKNKKSTKRRGAQLEEGDDLAGVPFIPDMKLLESRKTALSEDEVAAIGVSLYLATEGRVDHATHWGIVSRIEQLR